MNTRRPRSVISSGSSEITDDAKLEERPFSAFRRSCPSCGHDLSCNPDMVGLPAGLKFDPSDQELIQHLESMVKEGAHPLIDEFIPTIQGEDGICYTHPEKLPGVTRDGLSKHFFHRPSKAYTTGTRKRRKIQAERDLHSSDNVGETRWHKTGKTRPVIVGGRRKGCKKILVLYTNFGKQRKPEKTNWVMHQYHLGDQEEKDGELVVSKVFYQTQPRSTAATVEQRTRNGEKVAETSEAMQDVLPGCAAASTAAAIAMVQQRQQQQQQQHRQADDQCKFPPANNVSHEVEVAGDQGEQHDNHHVPSQHHERTLQAKPVPIRSFIVSSPSNTVSTLVSPPAIQHASGVLENRFHYSAIILQNEKNQEQQQKKVADSKSVGLEELMIACQSASTEAGAQ